jgi:AraC family transcriptional regulator of adaptative response/methylated-DNA-[protein]-cysteine methyltransferase
VVTICNFLYNNPKTIEEFRDQEMTEKINLNQSAQDYQRIEAAIRYLEQNYHNQPSLDEIAASVYLSKYHFQRLFKRWAGVSPIQFMHYLSVEYAKEQLRESRTIFDTSLETGLSSPSRLHDLFISYEAMTPGEYKARGRGLLIEYGIHPSPFGDCLIAITPRGICGLRFLPTKNKDIDLEQMRAEWSLSEFVENAAATLPVIEQIFNPVALGINHRFHLLLRGTNFQVQVWRALLAIPPGGMVTYQDIAEHVAGPKSARAAANAVARNPVAYLIPCHRVIRKSGQFHNYRWGASRKRAILGWEASQTRVSQPTWAQNG